MQPANTLHIETLDEGWGDKDEIMLHACFQLLKDCIEKENLLTSHTDWNADEKHRQAKEEIEQLYKWWLDRIKTETDPQHNNQHQTDNLMLHRLIDIRWALWT